MTRAFAILAFLLAGFAVWAEPVCVGGVCYPDEATARAAGALPAADEPEDKPTASAVSSSTGQRDNRPVADRRRLAMGYMSSSEFVAFLKNEPPAQGRLEDHALAVVLLLVLLGGLAANLTPCVLPLVPVNLIIIGRGWRRGAAYAVGIATAYGLLGLAAAFGALAFGTLQSSPYFNFAVAAVFVALALAMWGVFSLPQVKNPLKPYFTRKSSTSASRSSTASLVKPYLLGLGSATLASACVEPILIATLLLTAKWFAAGKVWAVALPFVLGAGMGLPYPFAAAGFSVLPKPGAWMDWVKRGFSLVFAIMAIWYGAQGVRLILAAGETGVQTEAVASPAVKGSKTLIKIGAPWCRNCAAMERTVLRDPAVEKALAEFAAVRRVEIDTFADLAKFPELQGLDIKGLPAYVVLE